MDLQKFFDNLSDSQVDELNNQDQKNHEEQLKEFDEAYNIEKCYLCGESFNQMLAAEPCIHWLLRRAKFKKKDFPKIYERYGYHNIAAFLRWRANRESPFRNINDLEAEKAERKVLCYTICWKNVEWSFDCTYNDLAGHSGHHSSFPHYHFQMRVDGRSFITFNEFHVPFTQADLFLFDAKKLPTVVSNFGVAGGGMQMAVDVDPQLVINGSSRTESEDDAVYHLSTVITAGGEGISGDIIAEIYDEAKRTGKTFASIAQVRLKGKADVKTVVAPVDSIPDIAARTEHKR
jgi:hypothetical protein